MKMLCFLALAALAFAQDCTVPYDGMVLNESTALCPGTYYVPNADYEGAIKISTSGVELDCNGATLIGDEMGKAVVISGRAGEPLSGISIRNCDFRDYAVGIFAKEEYDVGPGTSWNYCSGLSCLDRHKGIFLNLKITGNRISGGYDGITLECVTGGTVEGNRISNLRQSAIRTFNSKGVSIANNRVSGVGSVLGLYWGSENMVITGNALSGTVGITGWAMDTYIAGNTIDADNSGISLGDATCGSSSDHVVIFNNVIRNAANGIVFHGVGRRMVEANFFEDVGMEIRVNDAPLGGCFK